MGVSDPQLRIAQLETALRSAHKELTSTHGELQSARNALQSTKGELQWANLKIQMLEEKLRLKRIQILGPNSETLNNLQLALLVDEEPGVTSDEVAASKKTCHGQTALEVPAYISPVALVYNLDGVDKLQLSAKTAAEIFSGKVKTWNDPAIKAENPGAKLPGDRIVPVHRSDGSGTTDNLTQWMSKAGEGAWTSAPGGDWPLKGGEGAEGTSGVIDAVKNGKGTIGYADDSQAGELSKASIKVGSAYVAPSAEGATKVIDLSPKASGRAANDMAIDIDRTTTEAGAYPLTLASYVIACPTYSDKNKADLVKGYLTYLLGNDGQAAAAKAAGSAPLPSKLSTDAVAIADKIAAK